tara:strand:+ start:266 stop:430 length:165 start_codon:yes stop_codon:yes gene_type:complete
MASYILLGDSDGEIVALAPRVSQHRIPQLLFALLLGLSVSPPMAPALELSGSAD